MNEKVVLAYSGGLDTSVMVKWFQEKGYEVITMTGDVGQPDDLDSIEAKAKKLGAVKTHTLDLKKEFAEEYILPALKANALYEGSYPVATAIARPLLAKKLVEIAEQENASAIAHGCTGKGNDQVRFEVTAKALNSNIVVLAPVREWNMTRTEELAYAKEKNIEIPTAYTKYSLDENLWGCSIESGPLEDSNHEPDEDAYQWTVTPEKATNKSEYLEITFEKGKPVALNGTKLELVPLIQKLNTLGSTHGIGHIDHIESRVVGIKSRETYECPAAMILITAHKDLEKLVLTKHVISHKSIVENTWAELVFNGLWMDPLKTALDAFVEVTQQAVNGTVKLKLYKGNCKVVGRTSPNSLYDPELATFQTAGTFDQKDGEAFGKLWGMQTVLYNAKNKA